jgi:hypothetical protein
MNETGRADYLWKRGIDPEMPGSNYQGVDPHGGTVEEIASSASSPMSALVQNDESFGARISERDVRSERAAKLFLAITYDR